MSELDSQTFNLEAVLAGVDYPETTVDVFFNERLGFTIAELNRAIKEAELLQDGGASERLLKELDELLETVNEHRFVVHLKGISEGAREAILASVRKQFPPVKDVLGREEENPEADTLFTKLLWEAHIVKIVDPHGKVAVGSAEVAGLLKEKAPRSAQIALNEAIGRFTSDVVDGFEFAAKEVNFL